MIETRYRDVRIEGDLVIGEIQVDWPGRPDRDPNLWTKFRGSERLMKIRHVWETAKAGTGVAAAIWKLSDGYGSPGLVPPQGYDWSGIRDSTEMATYAMLGVAEEWWADRGPWPWQRPEIQKA